MALSACASSGVRVSSDAAASFKTGESTEADIVAKLGKPTGVFITNGVRMIQYAGMQYQTRAATFIPVVGLFAGGADMQMSQVLFQFDAQGKLAKTATSEHITESRIGNTTTTTTNVVNGPETR
ncbi:MAG: hypothetical protein HQ445_07880 [Polaromonas sp.]|nr:hypothetical protein [Polaromonas sp.]